MSALTNHSPFLQHAGRSYTKPTALADGEWASPAEIKIETQGDVRTATLIETGEPVEIGPIEKMSKSKRNTVDPDEIIAGYGADVARWFMLSDSLPSATWNGPSVAVQGAWRFVQRLWRLVGEAAEVAKTAPAERPVAFSPAAMALPGDPFRPGKGLR